MKEYLEKNPKSEYRFFCDIETFKFNTVAGREHPTKYKTDMYSFAYAMINNDNEIEYKIVENFTVFLNLILSFFRKKEKPKKIILSLHNGNNFDNHFLRDTLIQYFDCTVKNLKLNQATQKANLLSDRLGDFKRKAEKDKVILEKRVKTKVNLEMIFFLEGIKFVTEDTRMKTNSSLAMIGKKLFKSNLIKEEYLKTDFDYLRYDLDYDMTQEQSNEYALKTFKQLTNDDLIYIRNDVLILAYMYKYYDIIYAGYDYNKLTYSMNILDSYTINSLATYQLLKKYNNNKGHIKYTDYQFDNQNFFDWLRPFFKGGINLYNDRYVNTIITDLFSIDINSSYPLVMYQFDIPTFLNKFESFNGKEQNVTIDYDSKEYFLYKITTSEFDALLKNVSSMLAVKLLVKYYSTYDDTISINTYTLKLLKDIFNVEIHSLNVLSYVSFLCVPFGAKSVIEGNYRIKTLGKSDFKLDVTDITDIKVFDEKQEESLHFSKEEYDLSKVKLNGIFGIPSLRPYYNLFRKIDEEYVNHINGFKNTERNIVFSLFVTSVSLYNLLTPLKYLSPNDIDENVMYMDTDSLYMKRNVHDKIPTKFYNDLNIGAFSIDVEHITHMKILNHKKYAYRSYNEKKKTYEITVKSGGIAKDTFNTDYDTFEEFADNEFYVGAEVNNKGSILNEDMKVVIYDRKTKIKPPYQYQIKSNDGFQKNAMRDMLRYCKEQQIELNDVIYVETPFGTLSETDINHQKNSVENKNDLHVFKSYELHMIDNILNDDVF